MRRLPRGSGARFICAWKVMTFLSPFRGQTNGNGLPGMLGCSQKPGRRLAKRPLVVPLYFSPLRGYRVGPGVCGRGRSVTAAPQSALTRAAGHLGR